MDIIPGQTLPKFFDSFNQQLSIDNPIILILLTIIIIIYYLVFKYLGLGTSPNNFGPSLTTAGLDQHFVGKTTRGGTIIQIIEIIFRSHLFCQLLCYINTSQTKLIVTILSITINE